MKKNALAILVLLLLASALTLSTLPTAKANTITVDGDPDDWTGTAPTENNTWAISNGEFVWTDEPEDDTGTGLWEYPTSFAGGEADLLELRITWDPDYLYVLFKLRTMTEGQWNRTAIELTIDTDRVNGSGVANGWYYENPDMKVVPAAYWEYYLTIIYPTKIWVRDLDWTLVADLTTDPPLLVANSSTTNCFEVGIPLANMESPAGKTWRFTCIVGVQDMLATSSEQTSPDYFAEIEVSADAHTPGGGVVEWEDPDAFDAAFYNSTAEQEAEFSDFEPGGGDNAVVFVSAYKDIEMDQIPEFPLLLPYGFALMAAVILAASFTMRKKLNL